MHPSEVAALEARTYRTSTDHGLIELVGGGYLVLLGTLLTLDLFRYSGLLGGLAGGIAFPIGVALRHRLVEPRLVFVRLKSERRARLRWTPCLAAATLALAIVAGFQVAGNRAEFAVYPGFIPALVFAAPLAVTGYVLKIRRMYVYAALLLLERAADAAAGPPFEFIYWPSGLVMMIAGAFVLREFLQRYPLPAEGGIDA